MDVKGFIVIDPFKDLVMEIVDCLYLRIISYQCESLSNIIYSRVYPMWHTCLLAWG